MGTKRSKRAWRFQPVWAEFGGDRVYSLCRVYIMPNDTLDAWSDDAAIVPQGNGIEDLSGELTMMITDAWRWEPVQFDSLKVGMVFERRLTPSQSEGLAQMVEAHAHNLRSASDRRAPGSEG